jgi:5-methylcytosine-specific restriction endonuclease McrA
MQLCTRCGMEITPQTAKPNPKLWSGISSWCRPCHVAATRAWRKKAGEALLQRKRAKYHADPAPANARRMALHRKKYPLTPRLCITCQVEFTPQIRTNQKYCTEECQKRHRWEMRIAIPYRVRRAILKRDNWHCYLCNRAIDPTLRWPHEFSGTIDHVIPYSVCKHHEPDNLRAAHWRCNYDKGDSLPGTEVWVPAEAA